MPNFSVCEAKLNNCTTVFHVSTKETKLECCLLYYNTITRSAGTKVNWMEHKTVFLMSTVIVFFGIYNKNIEY